MDVLVDELQTKRQNNFKNKDTEDIDDNLPESEDNIHKN